MIAETVKVKSSNCSCSSCSKRKQEGEIEKIDKSGGRIKIKMRRIILCFQAKGNEGKKSCRIIPTDGDKGELKLSLFIHCSR